MKYTFECDIYNPEIRAKYEAMAAHVTAALATLIDRHIGDPEFSSTPFWTTRRISDAEYVQDPMVQTAIEAIYQPYMDTE